MLSEYPENEKRVILSVGTSKLRKSWMSWVLVNITHRIQMVPNQFELYTKIIIKTFYMFLKVLIEEDVAPRSSTSFTEESSVYYSWSLRKNLSLSGNDVHETHFYFYNWIAPSFVLSSHDYLSLHFGLHSFRPTSFFLQDP